MNEVLIGAPVLKKGLVLPAIFSGKRPKTSFVAVLILGAGRGCFRSLPSATVSMVSC
jgi:hypothetical protein